MLSPILSDYDRINSAYCIAHAKHSYYIPVYKTWLRLEVCHSCIRLLLSVLSISLRRVARSLRVPQTNSIGDTNRMWHSKLCTGRCTLGVHVGTQMQSEEYTAYNMAATKGLSGFKYMLHPFWLHNYFNSPMRVQICTCRCNNAYEQE